jgi:hypothetical protein
MEEWRNGGMEEWRSGGVEEWRSGGVEELAKPDRGEISSAPYACHVISTVGALRH